MKKLIILFLVFLIVFTLMACNKVEDIEDEFLSLEEILSANTDVQVDGIEEVNEGVEDIVLKDIEVVLYFANNKYIETGDEAESYILGERRNVEYGDVSLYEAIILELMQGPINDEELSTFIPDSVTLLGIDVINNIAYVDFSEKGLHGGSMEEYFIISQIANSLIGVNDVEAVQFLIDGEIRESLMGHFDTSKPLGK